MAYRRARPGSGLTRPAGSGRARSERIWTGRARLYRRLAGLARWEHCVLVNASTNKGAEGQQVETWHGGANVVITFGATLKSQRVV